MKCLLPMKITVAALLILILAVPASTHTPGAASPDAGEKIDWLVISGGAVDGSGSGQRLVGTVGQPAAGESTAGSYRLCIGYWQAFGGGGSSCCVGRVGDANGQGGDEPTIGDISVMIDAKFIAGTCDGTIVCLPEADVNQSASDEAECDDITIGDISMLIDYLFIGGPGEVTLPDCL